MCYEQLSQVVGISISTQTNDGPSERELKLKLMAKLFLMVAHGLPKCNLGYQTFLVHTDIHIF